MANDWLARFAKLAASPTGETDKPEGCRGTHVDRNTGTRGQPPRLPSNENRCSAKGTNEIRLFLEHGTPEHLEHRESGGIQVDAEDWRSRYEERAAIREYDGCMPRADAEREAYQEVLHECRHARRPDRRDDNIVDAVTADLVGLADAAVTLATMGVYPPRYSK